ncbi:MAG: hypothetical protein D3924_03800 [Candidatus Electrothrix sp. AR4]|nr:hypothetical protein [Candidatus Electrothrix sp. AR4]
MYNGKERRLPVTLQANIFFGGFVNPFGWCFFGFALNADLSFLQFAGKLITVQGTATDSIETNASVDALSIYEDYYWFVDERVDTIEVFSVLWGGGLKTVTL